MLDNKHTMRNNRVVLGKKYSSSLLVLLLIVLSASLVFSDSIKTLGEDLTNKSNNATVTVEEVKYTQGETRVIVPDKEINSTIIQNGNKFEMTVYENQPIQLITEAKDPDQGDNLTYYYGNPFNEKGEWTPNFNDEGSREVDITVSDGRINTTSKLAITVLNKNRVPELKIEEKYTLRENDTLEIKPVLMDPDNDKVSFKFSSPLTEAGYWQPKIGDQGFYTYNLTASDGKLEKLVSGIIVVKEYNYQPVISSINPSASETVTLKETETIKFNVVAQDKNKEDVLKYRWLFDGNETIALSDTFEYNSNYDSAGSHQLEVIVSDWEKSVSQKWNIFVYNVNREPTVDGITAKSVKETQKVKIIINATDPDGDKLIIQYPELFNETGEWTTSYKDAGNYTLNVVVSDVNEESLTVIRSFSFNVENVNRKPVIVASPKILTEETNLVEFEIQTYDEDFDDGVPKMELKVGPNSSTFEKEHASSYDNGEKGVFRWQTDYDTYNAGTTFNKITLNLLQYVKLRDYIDHKTFKVDFSSCDPYDCVVQTVKVTVKNKNRDPTLYLVNDVTVKEGETVKIALEAIDPDNDLVGAKIDKFFKKKSSKGEFEWVVPYDAQGEYTLKAQVYDPYKVAERNFKVTVIDQNRAPTFDIIKGKSVKENETIKFEVSAKDPDNELLMILMKEPTYNASFAGNSFIWKPTFESTNNETTYYFNFEVLDSKDGKSNMTVPITVKNVNRPLRLVNATPLSPVQIYAGSTIVFGLTVSDPDDSSGKNIKYFWNGKQATNQASIKFNEEAGYTLDVVATDGDSEVKYKWEIDAILPNVTTSTSTTAAVQTISFGPK